MSDLTSLDIFMFSYVITSVFQHTIYYDYAHFTYRHNFIYMYIEHCFVMCDWPFKGFEGAFIAYLSYMTMVWTLLKSHQTMTVQYQNPYRDYVSRLTIQWSNSQIFNMYLQNCWDP